MNTWVHLTAVSFLAMLILGCAAKDRGPSHKDISPSPEIVEKDIKPKSIELESKIQETTISKPRARVTAHRLNLREKGSAKGHILAVLEKGDGIEIMSRKGNWLKVKTEKGVQGWVFGRYVRRPEAASANPEPLKKQGEIEKISKMENNKGAPLLMVEELKSGDTADKPDQSIQNKKTPQPSTSLRADLENVWAAYLKANRSGDLNQYKEISSTHSYVTMVNALASAGRELTSDTITSMAEFLPDPSKLEFVEVIENGPTVGLVYKNDEGGGDNPNLPSPLKFSFIKFVQEPSGWKVDGILTIGKPSYQRDGSQTRFDSSDIPEELALDGKVLDAPQPMSKAEVKGVIDILSYGYKTEVTINGTKQNGAEDSNASGYVEGGLQKGENHIDIVITPLEGGGSDWEPSVKIRYFTAAGKGKEAFSFQPEKEFEGRHNFTFRIAE